MTAGASCMRVFLMAAVLKTGFYARKLVAVNSTMMETAVCPQVS
jgi:hypothetical protein